MCPSVNPHLQNCGQFVWQMLFGIQHLQNVSWDGGLQHMSAISTAQTVVIGFEPDLLISLSCTNLTSGIQG